MSTSILTRPASWPNVHHGTAASGVTRIVRTELQAQREEAFMASYVSPYFLPKKLVAARKRAAVKLPVPVETLESLILAVQKARLKGTKSVSVGVATVESLLAEVGVAA